MKKWGEFGVEEFFDVLIEAHISVYTSVMIAELIIALRKQASKYVLCERQRRPFRPCFFYFSYRFRGAIYAFDSNRVSVFFFYVFFLSLRRLAPIEWKKIV